MQGGLVTMSAIQRSMEEKFIIGSLLSEFEILGLDDHRIEWRGKGLCLNGKGLYRRLIIKRRLL